MRRCHAGAVALFASTLALAQPAAAQVAAKSATQPERPMPWDALGQNWIDAMTGRSLLFFGAAVLSTGAIAESGIDGRVHDYYLEHDVTGSAVHRGFFIAGNFVPAVVPAGVWIGGLLADRQVLAGSGAGALQAVSVSFVVVHVLKFATGRPLPTNESSDRTAGGFLVRGDDPKEFFRWGGVAWPSGHTSAMFSVVAAAHAYYPDQLWVALVGYPLATMMGYQMVEGHYHWVSDTIAGALVGWTIGHSIGKAFRVRYRDGASAQASESKTSFQLAPMVRGAIGATVVGVF